MDRYSLEFLSARATMWLALAPAFLALAVWVYYRTLAPLERPARFVLRCLRGVAFLIVLFALAEPVLTLILPEPGKPGLAVLVDRSASMMLPIADRSSRSRNEEAVRLVERVDAELSDRFRLDWFDFRTDLLPIDPPLEMGSGGNTALGDVIDQIAARQGSRPVGGVVLLSDGANTVGIDPVGAARNIGIPIFPVRIGQQVSPIDARILQVRTNPVAFTNEPTPVEVTIASAGLRGRSLEVRVEDRGRILASKQIIVEGGDDLEQVVRFDLRPNASGDRRFEVRIVGAEDAVPENDLRSVGVEVLERKTRVLVLEGRLDWDHTFLRRTLSSDSTFVYDFLLCDRQGRWLPERAGRSAPAGPETLRDYAVVILGDVPESALSARFYGELAGFIERGGALLALGGRTGLGRLERTPVGRLLPAKVTGGPRGDRTLPIQLAPAGRTHPVTALDDRPGRAERAWGALPPVWPSPDRLRAKPDATVLLGFAGRGAIEPALVTGFAGEGKVALLAAHDFWRWGFLPRATGDSDANLFEELALRLVRWLAEPTKRARFLGDAIRCDI